MKGHADGNLQEVESTGKENWLAEPTDFGGDLDAVAREGARQMLVMMLDMEVTEFLGRQRYERVERSPGYRNGYGKARQVTLGTGTNVQATSRSS